MTPSSLEPRPARARYLRSRDRRLFLFPRPVPHRLGEDWLHALATPADSSAASLHDDGVQALEEKEVTAMNRPVTVASVMFAVHAMFRREFGQMSHLVRAVAAGDTQRATLVTDHIALVSGVMSEHDRAENRRIWPLLRERCPEECTSLLDVVKGQHQDVGKGLLQVEQAQESWRDGASAQTRGALADIIDRLIPVINEHLALEEERVVPLIEKHISRAEYAVSVTEQAAAVPPGMLPTVWGMVIYEGDPGVGDMILSEMPVEVQPVIKDLAVKAHASYARELYRTVRHSRVTGGSLAAHDGKPIGVSAERQYPRWRA